MNKWSSINQKSNTRRLVILCMGAAFGTKNSCLVARIFSFDIAGMHLITLRILEEHTSKILSLISVINDANFTLMT